MLAKSLAPCLAVIAGLALASPGRADDIIRLALPGSDEDGTILQLKATEADLEADIIDVQRGRGGGGFRGGGGGFRAGGFRGGFGGARGFGGFRAGGFR